MTDLAKGIPSVVMVVLCGLGTSAGCQRPTHRESKIEATNQWNNVRARVKQQLARQQFAQGLFEDAIANASAAISLAPKLGDSYVLTAFSQLELGRSASAQATINNAIRLGVVHGDLHYARGVLFEQRGDVSRAVEEFAKAREIDSTRIEYLLAHAECLATLDRGGEAVTLLVNNLDRFDDSHEVATLAARVAELGGDRQLAIEYYAIALARGARDPSVSQSLGLNLARAGRCGEAVAVLASLLESDPPLVTAEGAVRRELAGCLLRTGDSLRALEVIADYADENPRDPAATALRATAHWRIGDPEAALAILSKNVLAGSAVADLRCLQGEILADLGRDWEASEAFLQALRGDPGHFWAKVALDRLASDLASP